MYAYFIINLIYLFKCFTCILRFIVSRITRNAPHHFDDKCMSNMLPHVRGTFCDIKCSSLIYQSNTHTHSSISLISGSILWIKLNKHMHNETKRKRTQRREKKTNQENTHAPFNFASKRIKCLCRPVYSHPQHVFSTLIESGQQYFLVHKIQTTVAWFYFIYIVFFLLIPS